MATLMTKLQGLRSGPLWSFVALALLHYVTLIWAYPGSPVLLAIFSLASSGLVIVALSVRPSAFGVTIAAFLSLGFAAKAIAHLVFGVEFSEPVGAFDGTPEQWDRALVFGAAGLAGCSCALMLASRFPALRRQVHQSGTRFGKKILLVLFAIGIVASIAIYYLNFTYHFNRIGYPPLITLPVTLQALTSFLISWGLYLSVLSVTFWLVQWKVVPQFTVVVIAALMGTAASVSMGSRVQLILYGITVLYLMLWTFPVLLRPRNLAASAVLFAVTMAGSLAVVSLERAYAFLGEGHVPSMTQTEGQNSNEQGPGPERPPEGSSLVELSGPSDAQISTQSEPGLPEKRTTIIEDDRPIAQAEGQDISDQRPGLESPPAGSSPVDLSGPSDTQDSSRSEPGTLEKLKTIINDGRLQILLSEVQSLIIMRWVGLEGVMTPAGVEHGLSVELFQASLTEDPAIAMDSIYQQMSGGKYDGVKYFTFLTLPGFIGVGSLSGNVAIIFAFAFACIIVGHTIEWAGLKITKNAATAAVVGVSVAYLIVQMPFPWSTFLFAVEISFAIVAIGLLRLVLATLVRKAEAQARSSLQW